MKKIINIILISISVLIFSCQNSTKLGYDILPEDDIPDINITDTFTVEVHTIKTDSIRTNGVPEMLLGEYVDPIFGHAEASFVTQFTMGQAVNFSSSDIVDSVILSLPYNQAENNVYGNPDALQNIEIYKINVDLYDTAVYYNTENPDDYKNELIGTKEYIPSVSDSILNIRLSDNFGNYFILADESNYSSTDEFHDFFKGILLTASATNDDGAVVKFNINPDFLITIYFHDEQSVSKEYKITANSSYNVRFNMISHDYSTANFAGTIDDETLPQDSVAYIQSGGGLIARIKIPYLKELNKNGKIAVNRAELIINTAPSSLTQENNFTPIERMFIANYIKSDTAYLIPDYVSASLYTGESYDENERIYHFDIAKFIQDIIDGNTESEAVNIYPANDGSNITRTVITSGNNSDKTKLVITYTKL